MSEAKVRRVDNSKTIECLPLEILIKILAELPPLERVRIERVCRRWRAASQEVWKNIQGLFIVYEHFYAPSWTWEDKLIESNPIKFTDNKIYVIVSALQMIHNLLPKIGRNIKQFYIHYFAQNYEHILPVVINNCHNIEIMEFYDNGIWEPGILAGLFRANKNLHSIKNEGSEACVEQLPIKDYKSLDLLIDDYCEGCVDKIATVIKHSQSLEFLHFNRWSPNIKMALSNCKQLKTLHFEAWGHASLDLIYNVPMLNGLTTLKIDVQSFDNDSLDAALQQCDNLETLTMSFSGHHPSPAVMQTLLRLPKLETAELSSDSDEYDELRITVKKAKHLTIRGSYNYYEHPGFFQMIRASKNLEGLQVDEDYVGPRFFRALVEATRERRNILKLCPGFMNYTMVSRICKNSKIKLVRDICLEV